ncbi:MAG: hypothetical protein SVY53_09090 [Chloroflexota bacterium]|nr:hypothetical protein [Chloroflexota bacterium]
MVQKHPPCKDKKRSLQATTFYVFINIVVMISLVPTLALTGLSAVMAAEYPPPAPEPIKWQQRPDMEQGLNLISMANDQSAFGFMVADDWLCLDGSPITDLHFWGSYPSWQQDKPFPTEPTPGVEEFRIRIFSNNPAADPSTYSHPAELLYDSIVYDFVEEYCGTISLPQQTYEHKYRYDMILPTRFKQERGQVYWLSISAVSGNPQFLWGWETSRDHWHSGAVQGWYLSPTNSEWLLITKPGTSMTVDMAFEITYEGGPIKWLQFPDMDEGINIVSRPNGPIVADDWLCTDGTPLVEIHFWGSYLTEDSSIHWEQQSPIPPTNTPGVEHFEISFHDDVPPDPSSDVPWSHPGDILREDLSFATETYWGSLPHQDQQGNIWWEHKFYYVAELIEPFYQEEGKVYWLGIAAKPKSGSNWHWGWETSKDHWNDDAVFRDPLSIQWQELSLLDYELAFEDLHLGTQYAVGAIFASSGIPIEVKPFQQSNNQWTELGHSIVGNSQKANGSGNELNINNVNLDFDLCAPATYLTLQFGEYGGNLNIEINGEFRNITNFDEINGDTIGDVDVTVANGHGNDNGTLTLIGYIQQFAIGGQELYIDNIALDKSTDMAFAGIYPEQSSLTLLCIGVLSIMTIGGYNQMRRRKEKTHSSLKS